MMKVRLGVWLNFRVNLPISVMENYTKRSVNFLHNHAAPALPLPACRKRFGQLDELAIHLHVATGHQLSHNACHHVTRGADPIGDLLLRQLV